MNITFENTLDLALVWLWCQAIILTLTGLGAPLVASISLLGPFQSKAFLHKLARQLTGLSLVLLLAILLCVVAIHGYCLAAYPELLPEAGRPYNYVGIGAFGLTVLLALIYRILWVPLKNSKSVLASLGLMFGLVNLVVIYFLLALKRTYLITPEVFTSVPLKEGLRQICLLPASSSFWPFMIQLWIMSITSASALGLVYLLLRRNRDDYGRDYYNFCLKHCARFAWISALLQLLPMGWLLWQMAPSMGGWTLENPAIWSFGAAGLAALLGVLMWNSVNRSATPLREKPVMILALLMPGTMLWAIALPFFLQVAAS